MIHLTVKSKNTQTYDLVGNNDTILLAWEVMKVLQPRHGNEKNQSISAYDAYISNGFHTLFWNINCITQLFGKH